jgi:hypothetical protein
LQDTFPEDPFLLNIVMKLSSIVFSGANQTTLGLDAQNKTEREGSDSHGVY